MLDFHNATVELFAPYIEQVFCLHLDAGEMELILAEANLLPERQKPNSARFAPRASFSLIWRGPENHFLEQGQYDLDHPNPDIGRIEGLFMTPVGKQGDEYLYQSIFN